MTSAKNCYVVVAVFAVALMCLTFTAQAQSTSTPPVPNPNPVTAAGKSAVDLQQYAGDAMNGNAAKLNAEADGTASDPIHANVTLQSAGAAAGQLNVTSTAANSSENATVSAALKDKGKVDSASLQGTAAQQTWVSIIPDPTGYNFSVAGSQSAGDFNGAAEKKGSLVGNGQGEAGGTSFAHLVGVDTLNVSYDAGTSASSSGTLALNGKTPESSPRQAGANGDGTAAGAVLAENPNGFAQSYGDGSAGYTALATQPGDNRDCMQSSAANLGAAGQLSILTVGNAVMGPNSASASNVTIAEAGITPPKH